MFSSINKYIIFFVLLINCIKSVYRRTGITLIRTHMLVAQNEMHIKIKPKAQINLIIVKFRILKNQEVVGNRTIKFIKLYI